MHFLKLFDPWHSDRCTCPPKYSLSPYTGCPHGCLYCYASTYIKDFNIPRPKKDFLKKLSSDLKNVKKVLPIALSNSSDCYQPLEKTLYLTRDALNMIAHNRNPVAITTKSTLVTRDIDIFKKISKLTIAVSLTTTNNRLSGILEPYAPSVSLRLKCIKKLADNFYTICRLDPLIYNITDSDIEKTVKTLKNHGVSHIITSTYKTKHDNRIRMFHAFPEHAGIWNDLYNNKGLLPQAVRKKMIKKVADCCMKENIHFSSCREGFSEFNTTVCDGNDL